MSDRMECEVEYAQLTNDEGREVPGVIVTCTGCDHSTESYGQSERSVRRCLALMRDECPEGQENYYVADTAP